MEQYRPAGPGGLVAKGADARYEPGTRRWLKYKTRQLADVVIGGVTGSLSRPDTIIAGRYRDGQLVVVGRSTPLTTAQATQLAAVLSRPARITHGPTPSPRTVSPVIATAPR